MSLTMFRGLSKVLTRSPAWPLTHVNPSMNFAKNFRVGAVTRNIINIQVLIPTRGLALVDEEGIICSSSLPYSLGTRHMQYCHSGV